MVVRLRVISALIFIFFSGWMVNRDLTGEKPQSERSKPELWVRLDCIRFNHDWASDCDDAVNIRKNYKTEVCVPEWEDGRYSHPAAYIRNRSITIQAVFFAAPGVTRVKIGAKTREGNLGDIVQETISFHENTSGKNTSGPVSLHVSRNTPGKIMLFDQVWSWYYEDVNKTGSPPVGIVDSRNKIYIILEKPQPPWGTKEETKVWADVLDLSCWWACGETTAEGAAERITRCLYNHSGGNYRRSRRFWAYVSNSFNLTGFLKKFSIVGAVNCNDMGMALVAFSNSLGCGLSYKVSAIFGCGLHCIKLIPGEWKCGMHFNNHAFATLNNRIFDASLKYDDDNNPGGAPHTEAWVTNISWCKYTRKIIKTGIPLPPKKKSFKIK